MSDTFQKRLNQVLNDKGMKAIDLANATGISKARISQYMNGIYIPKSKATHLIAKALGVNETWLMCMEEDETFENNYSNILPIQKIKLPLLGEIACGKPIYADEQHEIYIDVDNDYGANFCLKANGESMINAGIDNGDIVLIKEASMVNNGEIAAVIIEDEATLKRVYYYPEKGKLILNPENPLFEPLVYINEELNAIRIIGKAVAVIKKL